MRRPTAKQIAGPTARTLALAMLDPYVRHAMTARSMTKAGLGEAWESVGVFDYAAELRTRGRAAESGNLADASHILAAQALTLDAVFTELARRSLQNVDRYLEASERLMRLALKAQAGSRATLETLARLHQPREQTVRHVHVNEGGQAIVTDEFHHHVGRAGNANDDKQCHEPHVAAEGCTPLLREDAARNALPMPGGQAKGAMQATRRPKPGRAKSNLNAFKHGARSAAMKALARELSQTDYGDL